MHPNDDFLTAPELDYDGFRAALREDWEWFRPVLEADIFTGKVRTRRVFGFVATDLTGNASRVERTKLNIRRHDMECYYAAAYGRIDAARAKTTPLDKRIDLSSFVILPSNAVANWGSFIRTGIPVPATAWSGIKNGDSQLEHIMSASRACAQC